MTAIIDALAQVRTTELDPFPTPADVAMLGIEGWVPHPWLQHLNVPLTETLAVPGRALVVEAPVRHGKSQLVTVAGISWSMLRWPNDPVILGCHTDGLVKKFGRDVRRVVRKLGPEIGVHLDPSSSSASEFGLRGYDNGGFLGVGTGSTPTGRGALRMFIDDPIKHLKQLRTRQQRDEVWEWFTQTMRTRLQAGGSMVIVMSRWHEDDLVGRIFDPAYGTGDHWDRVTLPALAKPADPLGRQPGEPLCPELGFTVGELEKIRVTVGPRIWGANFDQSPQVQEGRLFDPSKWQSALVVPAGSTMVRWWDNAGTKDAGAYTAGVLLALTPDRRWIVVDVWRGRVGAAERRQKQRELAIADNARWGSVAAGGRVTAGAEQEPGSGGKEQAELFVEDVMLGLPAVTDTTSGLSKELRAETWAAQQNAGRAGILLQDGSYPEWARAFITEHSEFPLGAYKDQVDAVSHAHNWLALRASKGRTSGGISGAAASSLRTGNAGLHRNL